MLLKPFSCIMLHIFSLFPRGIYFPLHLKVGESARAFTYCVRPSEFLNFCKVETQPNRGGICVCGKGQKLGGPLFLVT